MANQPLTLTQFQLDCLISGEWQRPFRYSKLEFSRMFDDMDKGTLYFNLAKEPPPMPDDLETRRRAWATSIRRFTFDSATQCATFQLSSRSSDATPACVHVNRRRMHPVNFVAWTHGLITGQEAATWGHRYLDPSSSVPILTRRTCDTFGCCNPSHYSICLPYNAKPLKIRSFPRLGDLEFDWELTNF